MKNTIKLHLYEIQFYIRILIDLLLSEPTLLPSLYMNILAM